MADSTFLSQSGAYLRAQQGLTALNNCIMHLFQNDEFVPTPVTPLSEFLANECDFDGYTPATITGWTDPPLLAGQAWSIYAPIQAFRWVFATGVGNAVRGYFLVTAAGELYGYTVVNPPENCVSTGQAFIRTPVVVFPWGG